MPINNEKGWSFSPPSSKGMSGDTKIKLLEKKFLDEFVPKDLESLPEKSTAISDATFLYVDDNGNHMKMPVTALDGEPAEYLKDATISPDGNSLTLLKKDDTSIVFSPEIGDANAVHYVPDAGKDDAAKLIARQNIDAFANSAVDNTGIKSEYFVTLFNGPFTVTTATTEGYESPHALATVTGRLPKQFTYVVSVNGVRYDLPCDLDVEKEPTITTFKCYEYIGNLSLKDPTAGSRITKPIRDVPFLIVSDLDSANSIDIYTQEVGEFTIEVLQRHRVGEKFPNFNLYGTDYSPFEIKNNSGTFNGLSLGVNNIKNARGSMLIGYGNTANDEFGYAIGSGNEVGKTGYAIGGYNNVTAVEGVAVGYKNNVAAQCAFAEGRQNTSSGSSSHAEGYMNTASGDMSHSEGRQNISSGRAAHTEGYNNNASGNMSHAEGLQTNATAQGAHAEGGGTNADGPYSHAEGRGTTASHLAQHVFGEFNATDTSAEAAINRGNYVEIVGNGSDADHRANARTLDWDGNEILAGSLMINGDEPVATEEYADEAVNGIKGIIVEASTNKTVNGLQVPSLTDEQLLAIYNATAAGKAVTITDATGKMHFTGVTADMVSDEVFVSFVYFDKMVLEYGEGGETTFQPIGGGSGGGVTMDLLWENASPSSQFGAQGLTIESIPNYDFLHIVFGGELNRGSNYLDSFVLILPVKEVLSSSKILALHYQYPMDGRTGYDKYIREIQYNFTNDPTFLYFAAGKVHSWDYSVSTMNNYINVPLKIYGIK